MTVGKYEIVVIGNAGVDSNVNVAGDAINFAVESNFKENADYVGQAGGYPARGFAQLGKNTTFIGYVCEDYNGNQVGEALAGDGIDLTGLFIDPEGTAHSINFVYPDGRRKNFYDGKSHMTLQPDLTLCREILAAAGWPTSHFPTGPAPCCHWPKIWT